MGPLHQKGFGVWGSIAICLDMLPILRPSLVECDCPTRRVIAAKPAPESSSPAIFPYPCLWRCLCQPARIPQHRSQPP